MKRSDFLTGMGQSTLGIVLAPQLQPRRIVQSCSACPLPAEPQMAGTPYPNITEVGVGILGAKMTRILAPSLSSITCYEMVLDPDGQTRDDLADIFSQVRSSDLLFLVSGQEDSDSKTLFKSLGTAALEAGVLVVGIVPDKEWSESSSSATMTELSTVLDIFLAVVEVCFPGKEPLPKASQRLALVEYSINYTATPIGSIATQNSIGLIIWT